VYRWLANPQSQETIQEFLNTDRVSGRNAWTLYCVISLVPANGARSFHILNGSRSEGDHIKNDA
jgi:hypothetical protein